VESVAAANKHFYLSLSSTFLPSFLTPLPSPPCSRHTIQALTTTHQRAPPAPLAPPYVHLPLHKRCTAPASHELRGARVDRVRAARRGEHTRVLRAPDASCDDGRGAARARGARGRGEGARCGCGPGWAPCRAGALRDEDDARVTATTQGKARAARRLVLWWVDHVTREVSSGEAGVGLEARACHFASSVRW
jgi:hypothetical protein